MRCYAQPSALPALAALLLIASGCSSHGRTNSLPTSPPKTVAPSATPTGWPGWLAKGIYEGRVLKVDANAGRMLFQIVRACVPGRKGVWSVDLAGASFTANTEPATGEGEGLDLSLQDWKSQWLSTSPTWHLVYLRGQTSITDGPNTGCEPP